MEYKLYKYTNEYSGSRSVEEPILSRATVKELIGTYNSNSIELLLDTNAHMGLSISKERYSIHSTGPTEKEYIDPYFVTKTDRYLNFKYDTSADKYTWSRDSKISPNAKTEVICKWFNNLSIIGGDGSIPFGNTEAPFKVKPEHIDVGTSYYTLYITDVNRFQKIWSNSIVIIKDTKHEVGSIGVNDQVSSSLYAATGMPSTFRNKTILYELSTPSFTIGSATDQTRYAILTFSFSNTTASNARNTLKTIILNYDQHKIDAHTTKIVLKYAPIEDFNYMIGRSDYNKASIGNSVTFVTLVGYSLAYANM